MIGKPDRVEHVFYSGGFDTTSYLLECLLVKKVKVQPIVVKTFDIDGFGKERLSAVHEEVSRQNFYVKFRKRYPELSNNLLQEIIHDNDIVLDEETLSIGELAYSNNIFSRKINQLLYFYQASKDNNYQNTVIGYQKDDGINVKKKKFLTEVLNFKIPLADFTKKQMLEKGIIHGYDSFLYETWSCWYPQKGNTPCGECNLCKITIVKTKLQFPTNTII